MRVEQRKRNLLVLIRQYLEDAGYGTSLASNPGSLSGGMRLRTSGDS